MRAVTNGTTANYKYDGLGRRVEKEVINVGTTVTRYVYDNEDILLELDGSNNIVARYTHGPGIDEPLILENASASFFYHADGLGSITEEGLFIHASLTNNSSHTNSQGRRPQGNPNSLNVTANRSRRGARARECPSTRTARDL